MLDTNILIYILKNKPPKVIQYLNELMDEDEVCMSFVTYAELLKNAGTPIDGNDLWIACHALSEKATLVTNNSNEFQRIASLPIANWVR
jgi:tRNA(fMet)-specific endonuclease VapC